MSDVSVLGTGNMGAAIVRALLAHGLEVTAWNRTPAKLAALADEGASVAPTAAAALSASPLSVAIMADNTAVVQALTPRDGGEPSGEGGLGRVLLNLSTSAPEDVRACREVVEGHGITYLDGAVSGHPQDIGRDTSPVLICGDEPRGSPTARTSSCWPAAPTTSARSWARPVHSTWPWSAVSRRSRCARSWRRRPTTRDRARAWTSYGLRRSGCWRRCACRSTR